MNRGRLHTLLCSMDGEPLTTALRGDIDVSARQETLQIGYLHAVAAAAGCTLASPHPDVTATDWILEHPSSAHVDDPVAMLKVQLKATYQVKPSDLNNRSFFSFDLKNAQLEKLNTSKPTVNKILVVMLTPPSADDWLVANSDEMLVRHCAYWVNLAGKAVTGKSETSVRVPTTNTFDDLALCGIMARIGQGGQP